MSGTIEEEKPEAGKTFPLDLAAKITTVKAMDVKTPIIMAGQPLRNMRVLTQSVPGNSGQAIVSPTIITTNIVPQAVIKQGDTNRSSLSSQPQNPTSITLQRPTQITLAASVPMVAQSTYHVPRGPAVVANLAAPRSNVASAIRSPMAVSPNVQQTPFTRPPRVPSPAQGAAWLTASASNSSHIKGAPTVISSSVRGTSVTGTIKPQLLTRTQPTVQGVSTIRPTTTTILHSAITIGQGAQIHPYKAGQANTVTLAQVLPSRSQTLVYNTSSNGAQYTPTPRLTISTSAATNQRPPTPKSAGQVATARLAMPLNVTPAPPPRIIAPPTAIRSQHPLRIVATSSSPVIGRNLSVGVSAGTTQVTSANVLGQTRISTLSLHPLVAVTSNGSPRSFPTQGTKVITQPIQGNTIHLPQISSVMKSTPLVTTAARTVNVQQSNMVSQRPISALTSQTVSISKVFSQVETSPSSQPPANIFIHAPIASVPTKSSPGPPLSSQVAQTTTIPTTTVATYSLASGTYFYDASGAYSVTRPFSQQSSFAPVPQSNNQSIKSPTITTPAHGIVTNRFNPVMVVEQQTVQVPMSTQQQQLQETPPEVVQPVGKMNSSPRPTILRKRDHEGIPLRAAKNLAPALGIVPLQPPLSPPSRPDSGGNEHSSGGSTTVSATSSPGLADGNDDNSMPASVLKDIKEEEENVRPLLEMSPRKKPRKQQLTGNDMNEPLQEDMQFISETLKKEDSDGENRRILRKPANATLLNSYRQNWKATHNHYVRYSDVRPKDERRPTIMDLSNQYRVLDKVNGWKVHHLSTQMEDLAEQEQNVYDQLAKLLKDTEAEEGNGFDQDLNRINELIKGNLQRIKIINDGMIEAKCQIMKIFDHKMHVADIISRCASKRNFKKREKS